MTMRFPASLPPAIEVTIDRDGWAFVDPIDEGNFKALPVAERLALRREFEAQVALAKNTH